MKIIYFDKISKRTIKPSTIDFDGQGNPAIIQFFDENNKLSFVPISDIKMVVTPEGNVEDGKVVDNNLVEKFRPFRKKQHVVIVTEESGDPAGTVTQIVKSITTVRNDSREYSIKSKSHIGFSATHSALRQATDDEIKKYKRK